MKGTPAIEAFNLAIGYRERKVADNISLCVNRGEVVALLGRNGSGKSTLLRTLSGRLRPLKGEVRINGIHLERVSPKEMARFVSIVVAGAYRDIHLSARETVEIGRHPYTGFLGKLNEEDREAVDEAMKATGCLHVSERMVDTLSDGEAQKVSIARALAQQTPILMLDEPFSYIDVASRLELLALLKRIAREKDKAIIFSTHDVAQAFRYADRLLCFSLDGKTFSGTPPDVIKAGLPERLFESLDVIFDPTIMDYVLRKRDEEI